jgi:hypothetical protein
LTEEVKKISLSRWHLMYDLKDVGKKKKQCVINEYMCTWKVLHWGATSTPGEDTAGMKGPE